MPIIHKSSYTSPPFYQFNGHLQTILPGMFRKVEIQYERERLTLSDGDFVDLDWHVHNNQRLALLSHGLEGNSERPYIKGMAKLFAEHGWDVLAWNCRSCSGEMNRNFRLYNHGEIGDFGEVIQHINRTKRYDQIALIGFSMGGSITLKYLGIHGKEIPDNIAKAVAFSTPCDLKSGAEILDEPQNKIYRNRFLKKLKIKLEAKAAQFPKNSTCQNLKTCRSGATSTTFSPRPSTATAMPMIFTPRLPPKTSCLASASRPCSSTHRTIRSSRPPAPPWKFAKRILIFFWKRRVRAGTWVLSFREKRICGRSIGHSNSAKSVHFFDKIRKNLKSTGTHSPNQMYEK